MFSEGHNGNSAGLYNGLPPLLLGGSISGLTKGEKEREIERERERNLGTPGDTSDLARSSFFLPCSSIFYLKFSPLYHHTARGAACTCHQEIYTK